MTQGRSAEKNGIEPSSAEDGPVRGTMTEGEMAQEIAGLLWHHLEANAWASVESYDFGEVVIVTKQGTTYRLSVTIEDDA